MLEERKVTGVSILVAGVIGGLTAILMALVVNTKGCALSGDRFPVPRVKDSPAIVEPYKIDTGIYQKEPVNYEKEQ